MGAMQDKIQDSREKKKKRGSVKNASRLEAFGKAVSVSGADWDTCDKKLISAVVILITQLGGACTFGLSRDKGAHMLTLLLDDTRKTLWFNGDAVLSDELKLVIERLKVLVYEAD